MGNCFIDISIITAITALVAVIVGPLVTLRVTKMQNNASVIAKNRQEWINSLRDEISQIIVVIRNLETIMLLPIEHRDRVKLLENGELGKLKEAKIRLLINPHETDHAELIEMLHKALKLAMTDNENNKGKQESINNLENKIIKKSQAILKREWLRVKNIK